MDTLIPISGGWRSAYILWRWLKTHSAGVLVLHCRFGDFHDNDRDRAYAALRTAVEVKFPGRVEWTDASFTHMFSEPTKMADVFPFCVARLVATQLGEKIKTIVVPRPCGLGSKKITETILPPAATDALVEIPPEIFRLLDTCEVGTLPCGACPACVEIETARKQIRG